MEKSGVKRPSEGAEALLDRVEAVLVNVDGALTPVGEVQKVLLTYIKNTVESYVKEHWTSDTLQGIIDGLRKQAADDIADGVEGAVPMPAAVEGGDEVDETAAAVAASIKWQIDALRFPSSAGLLMLDVMREGFKAGTIHGKVFEDVPGALKQLSARGIKLYVITGTCSDTVALQMKYSTAGDLSEYVAGYYGTTKIGLLTEKETYSKLATGLHLKPSHILLLSHLAADAAAAHLAGLKTCLVLRPGGEDEGADAPPAPTESVPSIKCLSELFPHCVASEGGEDVSPHKKRRSGGVTAPHGGEEADGAATKVCVETGAEGGEHHK